MFTVIEWQQIYCRTKIEQHRAANFGVEYPFKSIAALSAQKSAFHSVFQQKVSRLEEQEKEVVSALRYFKTIVDKMSVDTKVLQMLPGSASKVLEAILPVMHVEARIQHR